MSDGATEIKRPFTHPFLVFNISARIFILKKILDSRKPQHWNQNERKLTAF